MCNQYGRLAKMVPAFILAQLSPPNSRAWLDCHGAIHHYLQADSACPLV
jgi:hypothetical protein